MVEEKKAATGCSGECGSCGCNTLDDLIGSESGKRLAALSGVHDILEYIGEDPNRQGLIETPERVVKSYGELFAGYNQDPQDVFKVFDLEEGERYDAMAICRGIEFYSTCEHHMLPFFGTAHVAYISSSGFKVIGLSKLARLFDVFARRLQVQERLGTAVVNALMEHEDIEGAGCVIASKHLCMCGRGVSKQHSDMVTNHLGGVFREPHVKQEFLDLIKI